MNTEFGLPPHTARAIREILASHSNVEKALLYGSRAKGNYKTGSDIDLTLLGTALNDSTLSAIARALDESSIPYLVDLSILSNIDNPNLLDHIRRVGKVFYQRQ